MAQSNDPIGSQCDSRMSPRPGLGTKFVDSWLRGDDHGGRSVEVPRVDDRHSPVNNRSLAAVCLGTGAVAALLALMVHRSLIDDAYITLSYARNLAFHFHWGLIR